MSMYDEGAKDIESESTQIVGLSRHSPKDKLGREKERLTTRLSEIDEALKLLGRNPDIERLLTILH